MPATALTSTTLSTALAANTTSTLVTVASNASHTVGQYIIANGEAMQVQSKVGTTGTVVQRGMLGTRARAHIVGELVYGSTLTLGPTQYEPFSGEQRVQLADPAPIGLPSYAAPLGTRKRDSIGNEYILCDFTTTVFPEQPVTIGADYTSGALGLTGRGAIGVVAETGTCTSDNWGWVQIYGRCFVLLGRADVSPSDDANSPTTLSTSLATRFMLVTSAAGVTSPNGLSWTTSDFSGWDGFTIEGMAVASDASVSNSVSTAGASDRNHVAVFLNYPAIVYRLATTA